MDELFETYGTSFPEKWIYYSSECSFQRKVPMDNRISHDKKHWSFPSVFRLCTDCNTLRTPISSIGVVRFVGECICDHFDSMFLEIDEVIVSRIVVVFMVFDPSDKDLLQWIQFISHLCFVLHDLFGDTYYYFLVKFWMSSTKIFHLFFICIV